MVVRILVFVGLVSAVYAVARLGFGPSPASLTILEIRGSSQQQGREGTSDIFGIDSNLAQPIDSSTGKPVGIHLHEPLMVLKEIDRASPLLHEALVVGRVLPSVTLDWYRVSPQKIQEEGYYVITLTQARVAAIETFMPVSFLPSNESYRHMERIAFTYQGVEWKWIPDSLASRDRLIDGPSADGDANNDLRIDLRDVAAFQLCVPMPSAGWFSCDDAFDFNSDYENDSSDWSEFLDRLTGP